MISVIQFIVVMTAERFDTDVHCDAKPAQYSCDYISGINIVVFLMEILQDCKDFIGLQGNFTGLRPYRYTGTD